MLLLLIQNYEHYIDVWLIGYRHNEQWQESLINVVEQHCEEYSCSSQPRIIGYNVI